MFFEKKSNVYNKSNSPMLLYDILLKVFLKNQMKIMNEKKHENDELSEFKIN